MGMCGYRDRIWRTKGFMPKKHEAVKEDRTVSKRMRFLSFIRNAFRGKVKV